jgi:hypothetical protein
MSRKHTHRRQRPVSAPMLINRGLQTVAIETQERMLVEAFANGWATTEHYDSLVDMRNVLTLDGNHKDDKSALAICDAMRIPMHNIRERYARTNRMGVAGEELQLLRAFIDYYADFWLRQPVALYEAVCDELGKFNESLKVAA